MLLRRGRKKSKINIFSLVLLSKKFADKVKEQLTGKNERKFKEILNTCGYMEDIDYISQLSFYGLYFLDFGFEKEKIDLEYDENGHLRYNNVQLDIIRYKFLFSKGWQVIRIKEKHFIEKPSYYKFYLKELIDQLRLDFIDKNYREPLKPIIL
jgi:very-short-patch-repair endonuclease